MTNNLKKTLFVSLAALGFVAAAGAVNAQTANAKTYARVTSNQKMTTDPTSRNVTFNGGNAIYTKAGTLRGARKVASTTTVRKLANSSNSRNNARAYRVATTNRGSVYYKVVTYDGAYRGWIYGGKSQASFGGGVSQYDTFKTGTLTSDMQNSTYNIASPGTANDNKTVTYKQPAWTQYKVGRAITDSTPYANTALKIDQVGTRTREGDQWVHVYDPSNANSPVTGWILYRGLKQVAAPVADNAIQINLVDPSNSAKVVKTITITRNGAQKGTNFGTNTNGNWSISNSDRASILNQIQGALSGTTYGLDNLSTAQMAQIGQATFGSSINLPVNTVTNIADNALRINFVKSDGTSLKTMDWAKSGAVKGNAAGSSVSGSSLWTLASGDLTDVQNQITTALNGTGYQLQASGNTLTANQQDVIARGTFGTQVYISVVPATTNYSTIRPYAYVGDNTSTTKALTGVSTDALSTPITFNDKNGNPITTVNGNAITGDVVQNVIQKYGSTNNLDAVNAINQTIYNAAATQYVKGNINFNAFTGTSGNSFNQFDAFNFVNQDTDLKTLKSPSFKLLDKNGNLETDSQTISYTVKSADPGTFGTPVNAYYSYPAYTTIK